MAFPRELSYEDLVLHYDEDLEEWKEAHADVVLFLSFISPDQPTSYTDPFAVRHKMVH
jgi:hypothetical protein